MAGFSRDEELEFLKLAVLELAGAAGLDLDEDMARFPGLRGVAFQVRARAEYEARTAAEAKAEAERNPLDPTPLVGYDPTVDPRRMPGFRQSWQA